MNKKQFTKHVLNKVHVDAANLIMDSGAIPVFQWRNQTVTLTTLRHNTQGA